MDSAKNQHGTREVRLEDDALVRGHGRFVDDARFPNQAFAVFVRSPHAFARIVSVDTAAARASKGVLAVLTAADMNEAGLKTAGRHPPIKGRGGKDLIQPFRPTLAGERVLYVGEAVAMVVAETVGQAQDGADLVTVEYEEQPAVVDAARRAQTGRAAASSRSAGQCRDRLAGHGRQRRERARGRRDHQGRGACRARHCGQSAADRCLDGNARRQCLLRSEDRQLFAARVLAERGHRAQPDRAGARRRRTTNCA